STTLSEPLGRIEVVTLRPRPRPQIIFFFQAEDGIRDATVTGVQTCALPIFAQRQKKSQPTTPRPPQVERQRAPKLTAVKSRPSRSEERRVGKEGGYRVSPAHRK